jgi:hypothetical protein
MTMLRSMLQDVRVMLYMRRRLAGNILVDDVEGRDV